MGTATRETQPVTTALRASVILTLTYVATDMIDCKDATHVEYAVDFTLGAGGCTGLKWTPEHSHDGSTWEPISEDDALAATTKLLERTITASVTGMPIKLKCARRYQRLTVKGLTNITGTLCAVRGAKVFGGA